MARHCNAALPYQTPRRRTGRPTRRPGLFTANGTGQGVAAAQFVAYPYQSVTDVFQCTNGSGTCVRFRWM